MEKVFSILKTLLDPTVVLLIMVLFLVVNKMIFKRVKSGTENGGIVKNSISFVIVLIGILAFVLLLPIDKAIKGQILSFLGILISAGIALSSTTLLGNLIAGIMNNSMQRFRNGDLIKIGDFHGRVTKKSAFHSEIQLEDSNFITIPNLYIASNPVKLTRKNNSVISTSISLGYDVPRIKIEEALKHAAEQTGLTDPYVYITSLGDFSVVYKIHGFLDDSNKFFSTSSLLNANVMDALHEKGIEIVSPTFMNQRRVEEQKFIPKMIVDKEPQKEEKSPEELIFDEAIKSEKIEKKKDFLKKIMADKEELKEKIKTLKDEGEVERLKANIERIDVLKERIEKSIKEQSAKDE